MLRPVTIITFQQQPNSAYPQRNKKLLFNFVHEFECGESWADLTNKAKIILPKKVYVRDETGKAISLSGNNVNIGGFSSNAPLFLRGDSVKIEAGYRYFDKQRKDSIRTSVFFQGYISNVKSKMPMELECEDNMWKLKQIPVKPKTYKETDSLEDILRDMLKGTEFTVNALTSTTFGSFRTENETVCEVLARLRRDYHFESYFRGNELRCGSFVYIENEAQTHTFTFQVNIISDDLEYKRKDDINLSAIAYSINKKELETTTKDGQKKTKKERLEVLVTIRNGEFVSSVKSPGKPADFAPNTAGERRTLYFWDVKDANTLIQLATDELKKYYYTGMRGKFTVFGLPFVRMGDNVKLVDPVLPERNGTYKVKSTRYSGGINGLRQEIELDYKIPT